MKGAITAGAAPTEVQSATRAHIDPRTWAVVIPSFRHAEDSLACIESIWNAEPRPNHVVLVDDASPDDSVEKIVGWVAARGITAQAVSSSDLGRALNEITWLTVAASPKNSGFTIASNAGLRAVFANTDVSHVLLLNNDAAVAPDFFLELAGAAERFPDAGLLTGTIYEWDRQTTWYAGGRVNPLRALAQHEVKRPLNDEPVETGFVSGCAMLIARTLAETIGVLPECYQPFYSEDVDYSLRARAAGFRVMYVPRAIAYHRVGASLGRATQSARVTFYTQRNRAFVIRRNFRGWRRAAGVGYLAVTKPARALVELARGRPELAWAILSGTITGLFSADAGRTESLQAVA